MTLWDKCSLMEHVSWGTIKAVHPHETSVYATMRQGWMPAWYKSILMWHNLRVASWTHLVWCSEQRTVDKSWASSSTHPMISWTVTRESGIACEFLDPKHHRHKCIVNTTRNKYRHTSRKVIIYVIIRNSNLNPLTSASDLICCQIWTSYHHCCSATVHL